MSTTAEELSVAPDAIVSPAVPPSPSPTRSSVEVTLAPASDAVPSPAPRSRKKGKRPAKKNAPKESSVLEWTPQLVEDLMSLRYDTLALRFASAKNNARLREAWVLLADDLSRRHDKPISTEQCKNKLKWLKRKWAEYNADIRATGNLATAPIEPPGLALMLEYWSGSLGMNGNTLADNEGTNPSPNSESDEASDDENTAGDAAGQQPKSKRRKTMGDSFEIGMHSMAASFQSLAAAITPSTENGTADDVAGLLDSRFAIMMERQEAQLAQMQMQTQYLAQLIETLQDRTPRN